jgi:transcriptional regulator with XRE-family HTH domain
MAERKFELGAYIAAVRDGLGLSQAEVAHRCGKHPVTIGNIEQGKVWPETDTLTALIRVLDLDLDYLFEIMTGQRPADPKRLALERRLIRVVRTHPVEEFDLLVRLLERAQPPKAERVEE